MKPGANRLSAIATLVLIAQCVGRPAHARCELALAPPQPAVVTLDPFDPVPQIVSASVTVRNMGPDACAGWLTVGREASAASARLRIEFANRSAGQDREMVAVPSIPAGQTQTVLLAGRVTTDGVLPPGEHTIDLAIQVGPDAAGPRPALPQHVLPVRVRVPTSAGVNVAGGGQTAAIDFGQMTEGQARTVVLQARSNQRFTLRAASDNGGVLRLDPAQDGGRWKVPYTVRVGTGGHTPLPISPPLRVRLEPTPKGGIAIPMEVRLGDPSGQRAGRYKDTITIGVDPEP
jgi:hypothetical protein